MKITLTMAEAKEIVGYYAGVPSTVQIEITDKKNVEPAVEQPKPVRFPMISSTALVLWEALNSVGVLDTYGQIKPDQRILAIKTLKDSLRDCSLYNAKFAIEDWNNFFLYIVLHGIPWEMSEASGPHPWQRP